MTRTSLSPHVIVDPWVNVWRLIGSPHRPGKTLTPHGHGKARSWWSRPWFKRINSPLHRPQDRLAAEADNHLTSPTAGMKTVMGVSAD